ncbi:hypothetical protein ACFQW6_13745 [Nocardioides sp. GCM10028917]|uniref:hypothetical protein n=1 Tax=Nocardioides sp. GCM10028917 TaxID=3273408 RepID=UPI0036209526
MPPSSRVVVVSEVAQYDGAPKPVAEALQVGRDALGAVRVAYDEGAQPDNRRFARDQDTKDDVTIKVAEATRVVAALEIVARNEAVQEQWFEGLTSGIKENWPPRSTSSRVLLNSNPHKPKSDDIAGGRGY